MIVTTAPNELKPEMYNVFLAGSIDNGEAEKWQDRLIRELSPLDIDGVQIINPRRDDWDSTWVESIDDPKFNEQVNWEHDALDDSDFILVYFDPNGKAPITLMEIGMYKDYPMIVCCPDGYWKKGNVEVLCERNDIVLVNDIEDFIEISKDAIPTLKEDSDRIDREGQL
jgi:hypothetical protein